MVRHDRLYYPFFQLIQEKISIFEIKNGGAPKTQKKEWNLRNVFWTIRKEFSLLAFFRPDLHYEIFRKEQNRVDFLLQAVGRIRYQHFLYDRMIFYKLFVIKVKAIIYKLSSKIFSICDSE